MKTKNTNIFTSDYTKVNFSMTNKRLPSSYISSIPQGLNLVSIYESNKSRTKGESNGFIFYLNSYSYISAGFNLNDSNVDEALFLFRIETMFSTLQYLNNEKTSDANVELLLQHIKKNSNYVFDVSELCSIVNSFQYNPSLITLKKRNYRRKEYVKYERKIDFLIARGTALKTVNSNHNFKELFDLLEERITNNDYGYIDKDEISFNGHKDNNLLAYAMARKFNLLCTGRQRKGRKQVNSEPIINTIKGLTLKSISSKPQQQNALMQKGVVVYERELKAFNKLITNREIAKQMLYILADLSGFGVALDIISDIEVQNQLKAELICEIQKKTSMDLMAEASEFDMNYKPLGLKKTTLNTDLTNIFDDDMSNSIFNDITVFDAFCREGDFFIEYMDFHGKQNKSA